MNKITLTKEDIDLCWGFAEDIIKSNNQYDRMNASGISNSEKIEFRIKRTFVGKIGELAFVKFLSEFGIVTDTKSMFEIFEGQTNVDNFDFSTKENESIDVKTAVFTNHTRLVVPIDQFINIPKKYYVGVKLCLKNKTFDYHYLSKYDIDGVIIYGFCTYEELKQEKTINLGEFDCKCKPLSFLHNIEILINKMK